MRNVSSKKSSATKVLSRDLAAMISEEVGEMGDWNKGKHNGESKTYEGIWLHPTKKGSTQCCFSLFKCTNRYLVVGSGGY